MDVSVLEDLLERGIYVVLSGYVAAIGLRIPAPRQDFGADRLGRLFVYIQQPDAGSAAGKPLGNRSPDAAARSCDYGEFAIEAKRM
jgi:hypothetical protein